jgi:hypothetical protein
MTVLCLSMVASANLCGGVASQMREMKAVHPSIAKYLEGRVIERLLSRSL